MMSTTEFHGVSQSFTELNLGIGSYNPRMAVLIKPRSAILGPGNALTGSVGGFMRFSPPRTGRFGERSRSS